MSRFRLETTALSYIVARSAPAAAGLLLVPVLVRSMSAEGFTRFGQSMALVNALIGFSAGWINQSQMRFVLHPDPDLLRRAKYLAALVNVAIGMLALTLARSWFHTVWWADVLLFVAMLLSLMATTEALARQQRRLFVSMEIVRAIALVLAMALSVVAVVNLEPALALGIVALSYLVSASWPMLLRLRATRLVPGPRPAPHGDVVRLLQELWRFGWPVGLWISLSSAMQIVDRAFANRYFGPQEAARYIALFEIYFRGVSLLMFPLVMAVYPEMIRRWAGGHFGEVVGLARRALLAQIAILFPAAIFAAWSSSWILPLLGKQFREGDGLMVGLMVAAAVFWQIVLIANKPLELRHKTLTMLFLMVAAQLMFLFILLAGKRIGLVIAPIAYIVSGTLYILMCAAVNWHAIRAIRSRGLAVP